MCQAGWQGERLWNLGILSAHSYPSTHHSSVSVVDLIHFPEHAKWTSLSWSGFPMVLLLYGNSSVLCNFRNHSGSIIFLSNLLDTFPLQFLFQICLKFSLFDSFSSDLEFQQHEERGVPWILEPRTVAKAAGLSLASWTERSRADEGPWELAYIYVCHLLLWWDWQPERESRK